MELVMHYAKLVGEVKMVQRVSSMRGKNLTDGIYDAVESYERVKEYALSLGGPILDADVAKVLEAITYRAGSHRRHGGG